MADFDLLETLKHAAAALREAEVPFLLGGGLAAWARGGPESEHDLVKPEDAEHALKALEKDGFRIEKPPEDWLYKAWDGDVLVDIIFNPTGGQVDDGMFARTEELDVHAVSMKVMALEDVMVTARALREQIDWDDVWRRTSDSPYVRGFFYLAEELGILEKQRAGLDERDSSQIPSATARGA